MSGRMTAADLQKLLKDGHCSVSGGQFPALEKEEKAGRVQSRKVEFDGHVFDSQKEAEIYREFKLDPDVAVLGLQPEFILIDAFELNGRKHRPIKYTADFLIKEHGKEWVVEVKSTGTLKANSKSYAMRRKLFLHCLWKQCSKLRFREIIFDGNKREIKEY